MSTPLSTIGERERTPELVAAGGGGSASRGDSPLDVGSVMGRQGSEAEGGATTLKAAKRSGKKK